MTRVDPDVVRAAQLLASIGGTEVEFMLPKEEWGPGEWQDEPDTLAWSHVGYELWMIRNASGAWCGYIEVPLTHPKSRDEYDLVGDDDEEPCPTHGGFTFQDHLKDRNSYVYGFDCTHAGDFSPALANFTHQRTRPAGDSSFAQPRFGEVYRNMMYVRRVLCEAAEWFKERE